MENEWRRLLGLFALGLSLVLSGCMDQSSAVELSLTEPVDEREETDAGWDVNGTYSGYIASLKAGESYYDIGNTLSDLQFDFDGESALVSFEINNTDLIDASGQVEFEKCTKAGDLVELEMNHEEIGRIRIKGTLQEKSFTGKIYFLWKGQSTTMNFITLK